jgi:6-pyruvoyltetrahydropterin/6-carboxytetrahydropterin synthase
MSFFKLTQSFYFEAAHTLKYRKINCYDSLQSQNIHGHTYHANITIKGEIDEDGMVKDFDAIKQNIEFVRKMLDHQFLDNVIDLPKPTLENLCLFIANKIKLDGLCVVSVERKASGDKCVYVI